MGVLSNSARTYTQVTTSRSWQTTSLLDFGDSQRNGSQIRFSVEALSDWNTLRVYLREWEDLAAAALEPNVFYEPWSLLPAWELFGASKDVQIVLVFAQEPSASGRLLCGLFPLERKYRYRGLPLQFLRFWKHSYCFLCTPLIRQGYGHETLEAFFQWLKRDPRGSHLVELNDICGDGPVHHSLIDYLWKIRLPAFSTLKYTRAFLKPGRDGNAYVQTSLSVKKKKELRRQARRLADFGRLEFVPLQVNEDIGSWIEKFLSLEASGWKGRNGTAFFCDEVTRRYFRIITTEAFRRKRLGMLALHLNGQPIAMKYNLLAGEGSFAFKIAYDETYAKFSPGMLLEIENIRHTHRQPDLRWMDSCADPDHFMVNLLWRDRRTIISVLVATDKRLGSFIVSVFPLLKWGKQMVKYCLNRLRGG